MPTRPEDPTRRKWRAAFSSASLSGEPVKVSVLRTATAASLSVLAAMHRKKWIARETAAVERDARRTERFAVLIPEARLPWLTAESAGNPRGAGRTRRRNAPR